VYTPVYRTSVHEIYLLNASGGLMLFSRCLRLGDFDLPYLSGTSHRTGLYWVKLPLLRSVAIRSAGHQLDAVSRCFMLPLESVCIPRYMVVRSHCT
jgi:hypothetical protein